MDEADGALEGLVQQVRVERQQLRRVEHSLVDDRPARHRGDVEVVAPGQGAASDRLLDEPPGHVEPALEGEVAVRARAEVRRPGDEGLDHHRLAGAGRSAPTPVGSTGTSRHPRSARPSPASAASKRSTGAGAAGLVAWQEDLGDAVARGREARSRPRRRRCPGTGGGARPGSRRRRPCSPRTRSRRGARGCTGRSARRARWRGRAARPGPRRTRSRTRRARWTARTGYGSGPRLLSACTRSWGGGRNATQSISRGRHRGSDRWVAVRGPVARWPEPCGLPQRDAQTLCATHNA